MGTPKPGKKILIYSPYWDIMGGGEKYLLDIAALLSPKHRVFLVADPNIKLKAKTTFGIDVGDVEFIRPEKFKSRKFYGRFFFLRQFDVCFYMTDGSLFIPGASRNFLIIQSPSHIPELTISTRFKISGWKIICYSAFMQKIIKDKFRKEAQIIPPAVRIEEFTSKSPKKSRIFLTVGRFFASSLHEKKQDFLIDFFKEYYQQYFRGWRLFICGNLTEESGKKYLDLLKSKIKNLPVELKVNISHQELIALYQKSSVYWHAAGYAADSFKNPEKMEHFGITTVEAMAAGNVPVVYSGGGQKEIVDEGINGYLWDTALKFLEINSMLVKTSRLLIQVGENARKKSSAYSFPVFSKKINALV